ncbi:MAG: methylase N-4/N-6 domain-containing protein [Candidatus Gottesmanbacteria bacterium GW2011_GWB1_49_7]|uniref:Methylase N-4/N-6 domain-containing protein n=1 Tax=Candidatus Gottesmanbacteria bacterium GW2011_GWB1_49_7 TaxID=1618448 RepID=A0A0G1Z1U9_9BACT|nr:MAG: methylase N-4/N-6 domain-containing protein [Candidatus Gottesmanbacteria bacterium GW2011_GWB1_49_7]
MIPPYKIQYVPLAVLHLNPKNPRLIKDAAFRKLVKSLADCPTLFDARPCICSDRTGENIILCGNMRYLAAKELKRETVPAIIITGLTKAQEREITIKDNGDFGEWDFDILSNEWTDLPLMDWGVSLPLNWLATLDDNNLPGPGSGKEKENETTCPKCGFTYAI